jgi:hypothetical protein
MTADTVARDTPAALATSLLLTRFLSILKPDDLPPGLETRVTSHNQNYSKDPVAVKCSVPIYGKMISQIS